MAEMVESEPSTQPVPAGAESDPSGTNEKQMPCFFRFFGIIVRIWGILTVAGLSISAWWLMTQRIDYPYTSWYTMTAAIVLGFLELIWIIEACIFCRDTGGMCCTCWRLLAWIDLWRKTIIYVLLSIPEFVIEKPAPIPFVCGALLILLAVLYLFKTCESCCGVSYDKPSKRSSKATQPSSEVKDTSKVLIKEQEEQ